MSIRSFYELKAKPLGGENPFLINVDKLRQGVLVWTKMQPIEDETFRVVHQVIAPLHLQHPLLVSTMLEDEKIQEIVARDYEKRVKMSASRKGDQTRALPQKYDITHSDFRPNRKLPQFSFPLPITTAMWHQLRIFPHALFQADNASKIADLHAFVTSLMSHGAFSTPGGLKGVPPTHPRLNNCIEFPISHPLAVQMVDQYFSKLEEFVDVNDESNTLQTLLDISDQTCSAPSVAIIKGLIDQGIINVPLEVNSKSPVLTKVLDLVRSSIIRARKAPINPPVADLLVCHASKSEIPRNLLLKVPHDVVSVTLDGKIIPSENFLRKVKDADELDSGMYHTAECVLFRLRPSSSNSEKPWNHFFDFWLAQEAMTSPARNSTNLVKRKSLTSEVSRMQSQPESSVCFERLEWLGDSILKLLASLSVFFNLDTPLEKTALRDVMIREMGLKKEDRRLVEQGRPHLNSLLHHANALLIQDEGAFTSRRQDLICNGFLEVHSKRHRLYSFVSARQLAESKKTIYTLQRSQALGVKPHADLIEALIGAVFCSNLITEVVITEGRRQRAEKLPFLDEHFGVGIPTKVPFDTKTGKAKNRPGDLFLRTEPHFDQFGAACKAAAAMCDSLLLTNFLPPWMNKCDWASIASVECRDAISKYYRSKGKESAFSSSAFPPCHFKGDWLEPEVFEDCWSYKFKNKDLLWVCRTNESTSRHVFSVTSQSVSTYQRFEFVGDAVLEPLVRYFLYSHFGDQSEKYLDPMRQCLVSNKFLALSISKRIIRAVRNRPEYKKDESNNQESKSLLELGQAICRLPIYKSAMLPARHVRGVSIESYEGTANRLFEWAQALTKTGVEDALKLTGIPDRFSLVDSKVEKNDDLLLIDSIRKQLSKMEGNEPNYDTMAERVRLEAFLEALIKGKKDSGESWQDAIDLRLSSIRQEERDEIEAAFEDDVVSKEESEEGDDSASVATTTLSIRVDLFRAKIQGVMGRLRITNINDVMEMNNKKRSGLRKFFRQKFAHVDWELLKMAFPDISKDLGQFLLSDDNVGEDEEEEREREETTNRNTSQSAIAFVEFEKYPRILADIYEATVFAIFVDSNFDMCRVWDAIKDDFEAVLPALRSSLAFTIAKEQLSVEMDVVGKLEKAPVEKNSAEFTL
eukprot:GDKJ01028178.1.p1 GENE.GDKJ01028178.1~~GDKJ01028178.1.p1  ORF type:complete len:1233 (-),score=304.54 GDKJ01028178.1:44-3481(-)